MIYSLICRLFVTSYVCMEHFRKYPCLKDLNFGLSERDLRNEDQHAVHLPKIYLQAEVNQFLRNESAGSAGCTFT